jgi:cyclin-dependent kinase-like
MIDYETLGTVGEGAYGIVLKCLHKATREVVAIKKFKDKDTEDSMIKKVIIRELKGLRTLRHPHIVHLRDAFRQNERLYLIFDFCDKSLLDLQGEHENNGLPVPLIRQVLFQTLKAIAFMHERNHVHRDIKPENILLTGNNQVKVCDFGFCRVLGKPGEVLTDYVATRWYRSPELLLSPRYGKSVDMWALGCVLGEMIDGNPMFPGDDYFDQLSRIYFMMGKLPLVYTPFFQENSELQNVDAEAFFVDPDDFCEGYFRERYLPLCQSESLIDLLERLLDLNCHTRMTAKEALAHPFFDVVREKEERSGRQRPSVGRSQSTKENATTGANSVQFVNTKLLGKTPLTKIDMTLVNPAKDTKKGLLGYTPFLPKILDKKTLRAATKNPQVTTSDKSRAPLSSLKVIGNVAEA